MIWEFDWQKHLWMFVVSVGLTIARYSENINNTEDTFFFKFQALNLNLIIVSTFHLLIVF